MDINDYEFFDNYRSSATGISDLDFRAARYMLRPFTLHTEEFHQYWKETQQMLKKLFQTNNDLIAMTGSIRMAFDAIIGSIVEPEDKVLVLTNGYWGNYVVRVVESYRGKPILVEESPSRTIKPDKVQEALKNNRDLKAVTVMHVETDTGTFHPVEEIGNAVKKNSNALYVVDSATSFGGMEVAADRWGADFCFSGSHKCMTAPVGLAFTTVSKKAWDIIKGRKTPIMGTYNDLLPWKEPIPLECEPPLPATTIHAIRARLDFIFRHGPEKIFKKHAICARAVRTGVTKLGLELLSESPEAPPCSNVVTTVKFPPGVHKDRMSRILRERYNIGFGGSPYRPECFQIGTINESQVNPRHILYFLTSLGLTLSELGRKVDLENTIRSADIVLGELEKL